MIIGGSEIMMIVLTVVTISDAYIAFACMVIQGLFFLQNQGLNASPCAIPVLSLACVLL